MLKDQKVYIKEDGVRFRRQLETVDGVEVMPKGQSMVFIDGPWLRVTKDGHQGWVHADYVSEEDSDSSRVINFIIGQPNPAAGTNTVNVRQLIKDVMGGGQRGDALQCTEYVSFRVKGIGVDINWPVTSGRNGGKWAAIFQKANLYKVLVLPQVNCAMCFTAGISTDQKINDIGHVAFVDQVFGDGSIRISEANWPHDGMYNERIIPKEKWQNQYKAQFVLFQ